MKIAVVQQPPVYLNLVKSMARAVELVQEAAAQGCAPAHEVSILITIGNGWCLGSPAEVAQ